MDKVILSAPFAKTVPTEDGGREVYGFATLEVKDKSGEIADFDGTLKAFEKWSNDTEQRTGGKSKGNVRVMHQPITAGKTIDWRPTETVIKDENDEDKTVKGIWVGAYIPPTKPDVIRDIDEGILSAFSIGGSYQKRWWDDGAQAFRFIPELSEYSLVDNPCVPGADITQVIAKANVPWLEKEVTNSHKTSPKGKPNDPEQYADPKNFKYPIDAEHIRAAVSYFNQVGQREDGGYTQEEWDAIGRRIASAASRLEGGEYKYENGKVVTPNKKEKGSEKAMTAEQLAKAAEQVGLTMDQVQSFLKALTPQDEPPKPDSVSTVDGDADTDDNKEFPASDDDASDQNKAENDVKASEKDSGVAAKSDKSKMDKEDGEDEVPDDNQPDDEEEEEKCDKCGKAMSECKCDKSEKAAPAPLAKEGKSISNKNGAHLQHAANHIGAVMKGTDYTVDDHLRVESELGQGNTGEEPPAVDVEKVFSAIFTPIIEATVAKALEGQIQKSAGNGLTKGFTKAVDDMKSLVKGLASQEDLSKAVSELETVKALVKEIHETPQAGGPLLNGGNPAFFAKNFNQTDMAQVKEEAIQEFVKSTNDPILKDKLGQELALRQARKAFQ